MKKYTESEFIELVNSQNDINFLAAAITPWHALGIDAAILQMTQQGISLKGYIMVVAHSVSGTGIDENSFCMKAAEGIKIIQITDIPGTSGFGAKLMNKITTTLYYMGSCNHSKNTDLPTLYWVVPLKPSYELIPKIAARHQNYRLSVILIDEGIAGTYLTSTSRWWYLSFKEGGWKSGVRAFWSMFVRDPYFFARLSKQGCIVLNQLLTGKAGSLVPNQPVIAAYRDILRRKKCDKDFSYYSNAVIINSDMLKETGILKSDIDIDILRTICEDMKKQRIPVILKPHPREKEVARYGQLECQIEGSAGIAQESIWGTLKEMPYCVVGFASTTLITAKLLFNIEAISLNYLVQEDFSGDKGVFEKFNHTFSEMIHFPKNIEELLVTLHDVNRK